MFPFFSGRWHDSRSWIHNCAVFSPSCGHHCSQAFLQRWESVNSSLKAAGPRAVHDAYVHAFRPERQNGRGVGLRRSTDLLGGFASFARTKQSRCGVVVSPDPESEVRFLVRRPALGNRLSLDLSERRTMRTEKFAPVAARSQQIHRIEERPWLVKRRLAHFCLTITRKCGKPVYLMTIERDSKYFLRMFARLRIE
jgi:hypothetical protein